MGTLKYMNLLLHIDIHLQSVKYIINEQSMNINVFLPFFSFVFLQIERERVYKIGYKEKWSQSLLIFFLWWSSCGESFFFYGLVDLMLFLTLAWRKMASSCFEIFFVFFYPEYLALVLSPTNPAQQLTFFFSISADGRESPLPFWGPSQSFGFYLPVSGDPSEVTKYKHLVSPVTHILS